MPAIRSYQEVVDLIQSFPEDIPLSTSEIGTVAAGSERYPIFKIRTRKPSRQARPAPAVFIAAGIHGDEPGGVWALLDWLKRFPDLPPLYRRFDFTIIPCINPYGYEHNTRQNAKGIDLNRQFRSDRPPDEVRFVKQAVGKRPFDLVTEFHEDVDTHGFYLYELTHEEEPSWGKEIIERVARRFPINLNPQIEGLPAEEGLIHRLESGSFREMMENRKDWPQAFYHYSNGSRHVYTTETPIHLSREERVEIHLSVLGTALEKQWERSFRPNPSSSSSD
jgi:hypothetical protein